MHSTLYYPGWSISLDNGIRHVDPKMVVKDLAIVEAGRFPATHSKIKDRLISHFCGGFLHFLISQRLSFALPIIPKS